MTVSIKAHKPDYVLLATIGILLVLGLLVMASVSPVLSSKHFGEAYYYLTHQVLYGAGLGGALFFLSYKIRYTVWKKFALLLLILGFILMMFVFVPGIGLMLKGASRWITVGPVTMQPGEVLKVIFIIYLASWLAGKRKELADFKTGFLPFLAMMGFIGALFYVQKDLGSLGVLGITSVLLFFMGGARIPQLTLLVVLGLAGAALFAYFEPYRLERIKVFLNPEEDVHGAGYQINQALIAIGSGGFFGRGFGLSHQKFNRLPEAASDSVFAIIAEEFGFVGSAFLISVFGLFFWRGFRVSARAPDAFGKALAAGITLLVTVQAFVNIAAISGLLPLTGIPLSFISYGSSALIMNLVSAGILLNISRYAR